MIRIRKATQSDMPIISAPEDVEAEGSRTEASLGIIVRPSLQNKIQTQGQGTWLKW
jgi:hypothetical protein